MRTQTLVQLLVALSVLLLVLGFSFLSERVSLEKQLTSYVGIWEEDTTRALILKQDSVLLEKILVQLKLFQPAVEDTEVSLLNQGPHILKQHEIDRFEIPLSLNLLPVGLIKIRLSMPRLLLEAALSPVFFGCFFLVLGFFFYLWNREFRIRLDKLRIEQEMRAQREIASVARQVAHDIRSPLTALMTIRSKLVIDDLGLKKLLESSCERIQGIAEDLLNKAKALAETDTQARELPASFESGFHEKLNDMVDLNRIIEILRAEFLVKYPQVQWVVASQVKNKRPLSLHATKLTRILANILQNSIDAIGPSSEGRINIEIFEKNLKLLIRIQDNGKGIPENLIPVVLEGGKSFGKSNGNGLGLSDSKKTIEMHEGRLSLHSKIQFGTLVQIELPILQ